jgi:hypothetical protein
MSAEPSSARQAIESMTLRERPKTMVAAPKTATATSILVPTLYFIGRHEK